MCIRDRHNNGGNFYGRAKVFSQMGFDTFTSKELMNITEYNEIASWPTDNILIDETTKTLDSTPDQSDFLYTITVQSHGSYPDYKVFDNPEIQVTGGDTEAEHYQWEYYINELHEVDKFIGNLIDTLSKRNEKTIVVMYGDHLPTLGPVSYTHLDVYKRQLLCGCQVRYLVTSGSLAQL